MAKRKQKKSKNGSGGPGIAAISIGAAAIAAGAAVIGYAAMRLREPGNAEHEAPDLALDQPHPGPEDRAPEAFRPDPTAPVPASEREGLRPATGPAPTLVEGRTEPAYET
ncbi:hypothetical protein [Sphingomonas sp.]|uniref:hypothetical protein n=1 Tax=Sphingomonas sp. TaxID=28214 RepID=UPI0031D06765